MKKQHNTKAKMSNNNFLIMLNVIFMFATSLIFMISFFLSKNYVAIAVLAASIVLIALFDLIFKKIISFKALSIVTTIWQFIIIAELCFFKGDASDLMVMMLAGCVFCGIYFSKTILYIQAALTNIFLILAATLFNNMFFDGVSTPAILRDVLALDVGIVFVIFLVYSVNKLLSNVKVESEKTADLLKQVEAKVAENDNLAQQRAAIMAELKGVATQVEASSQRMVGISKSLNNGAQRQQSAIGELTGSIGEIEGRVSDSVNSSNEASFNMQSIGSALAESNEKMESMLLAMKEINDTSVQIQKVIKTIDEIAFQTNILALNASVEASRAGAAGKGFAVVAEEVRNLAIRSSAAAKDTTKLIQNTSDAIETGKGVAEEAALSLSSLIKDVKQSSEDIKLISNMAQEQLTHVQNINNEIVKINDVTTQNASIAAQNTDLSGEIVKQAEELAGMVLKLNK